LGLKWSIWLAYPVIDSGLDWLELIGWSHFEKLGDEKESERTRQNGAGSEK